MTAKIALGLCKAFFGEEELKQSTVKGKGERLMPLDQNRINVLKKKQLP